MTEIEVLETAELVFCEIHSDYVNSAVCFECNFANCADCFRSYGCDNCY